MSPGDGQARFAREWNAAFGLVAATAALLVVLGHGIAGAMAAALAVCAFLARRNAMRRQGRGFYGQESIPADGERMHREELDGQAG
jgi:hypothetical protein